MKFLYKKRIRLSLIFIVILLSGIIPAVKAQSNKSHHLTSYVDPYIGADGHGHVFVGASVPSNKGKLMYNIYNTLFNNR
jgi:hypothetical protein